MKCVQLNNGHIMRVSDDMAASAVAKADGVYVSKARWRQFIRNGESNALLKQPPKRKGWSHDARRR